MRNNLVGKSFLRHHAHCHIASIIVENQPASYRISGIPAYQVSAARKRRLGMNPAEGSRLDDNVTSSKAALNEAGSTA
jgi:hypothetical protein